MTPAFYRLSRPLQKWIRAQGWTGLRPLQAEAIGAIMDGTADLVVTASTAGGKTEAAFLPLISQVLDDPQAPWLRWLNLDNSSKVRWCAALHIEMQRERWLRQGSAMVGYRSQARLLKSRWVYGIRSATVEIVFNGTVRAQETW